MKRILLLLLLLFFMALFWNDDGYFNKSFKKYNFNFDSFNVYYGKFKREKYLFVLNIPKIHLSRNIYSLDSFYNNVDYNIELLDDSSVLRRLFFLAGHSGNGDYCFFNHLVDLSLGDRVFVSFEDVFYEYVVTDIYYIDKSGFMDVSCDRDCLYLITCSLVYSGKQLIVFCQLL